MYYVTLSRPGQKHPDHEWKAEFATWAEVWPLLIHFNVSGWEKLVHSLSPQACLLDAAMSGAVGAYGAAWQDNELECLDSRGQYNGWVLTVEGMQKVAQEGEAWPHPDTLRAMQRVGHEPCCGAKIANEYDIKEGEHG